METVRAKLSCTSAVKGPYGTQVSFWALYSNNPEDNSFAQATPSAQLNMMVNNPSAEEFFEPGKTYFLDFKKVE
jgi:hypothetical protein